MRKLLFLLFINLACGSIFSQDSTLVTRTRAYISIGDYRKITDEEPDSEKIKIINGDSLVSVPEDFYLLNQKEGEVRVKYEAKDSAFLELYKNVVFYANRKGSDRTSMKYWKDDIKIYFEESVPKSHADNLMEFAQSISKDIDSLNIQRVDNIDESNYHVYYLNLESNTDFEPRIPNKTGFYANWNGKQQFTKASLKINTELLNDDIYQQNHLKYWFFISLGYFYTSNEFECGSMLTSCQGLRKVTKKDLEILKYHYSYGVCKGVNLKSFEELTSNMQQRLKEDPNARLFVVHQNQ